MRIKTKAAGIFTSWTLKFPKVIFITLHWPKENHLRFHGKGNRLHVLTEDWCAYIGKGRVVGGSIFREPATEHFPGLL